MKLGVVICAGAVLLALFLSGCSKPESIGVSPDPRGITRAEPPVQSSAEEPRVDRIPMVRIGGVLYYDTGRESTVQGRCGVMDGEITSSVEAWEIPEENDQSNFGSGFSYQIGTKVGTVELLLDGKWIVFASHPEEEQAPPQPKSTEICGYPTATFFETER